MPVDSSQPSPTTAQSSNSKGGPPINQGPGTEAPPPTVNRKKQKRRAKAAAKAAAEQGSTSVYPNGIPRPPPFTHEQPVEEAEPEYSADEDDHDAESNAQNSHPTPNGYAPGTPKSKKSKKKKKKNNAGSNSDDHVHNNHLRDDHQPHDQANSPIGRRTSSGGHNDSDQRHGSGISKEKIWNTSSKEERQRIKDFWLGLSEAERKSLVKVEKDAVLRKMKEQQKTTCSCSVCGRKRTAIEEELEGLYDAYYEELEQYANHPSQPDGPPMLPLQRSFASMSGMRRTSLPSSYTNHQPSHGRIIEHVGDDEAYDEEEDEGEDDYSEGDLEDDEYSDEEPSEDLQRSDFATGFLNFSNSLTVQGRDRQPALPAFLQGLNSWASTNAYGSHTLGGILTVADDLLLNDGKKFIEMMEQLAERRMQREEEAREQYHRGYGHFNGDRLSERHVHPLSAPPVQDDEDEDDEEEYEDEEDEEYDSQEEAENSMTEEQRMEEGRRMFQIFAARMFEQRVLQAYREKVARERQATLLEELDDEVRRDAQRKAKKAKEAQKRKDKAAKKKEALAEEKARREAEKAREEAARLAEEARKAEEQRAKAEEKRKKKEAQKKAEEEERKRKEAERQRRLHEREENERKAREAKEREKKAREEARLKEKEAREQKEREAREKKEKQEREKREKEAKAKAERQTRENMETKKTKQEVRAAQKAAAIAAAVPVPITLAKRPAPHAAPAVPALPQQSSLAASHSPQIPVATPAFTKAPTPMRVRQPSQQHDGAGISSGTTSQSGSAPSQNPSPHPVTPVHSSPGPIGPPNKLGSVSSQAGANLPSHAASPLTTAAIPLPPQASPYMAPPMGMPFPPGMGHAPPGFSAPGFPPPPGYRPTAPGMMNMPPGLGGPGVGRGYPLGPPPGFPGPLDSPVPALAHVLGPVAKEPLPSHSRQGSGSFDPGTPSQPISRPTPIGRPGSVVHGQRPNSGSPAPKSDVDTHLGSKALLDDVEDPLDFASRSSRLGLSSSLPRPGAGFPTPFGMDSFGMPPHNSPWGPSGIGHHQPMFPQHPPPGFGPAPTLPWGPPGLSNSAFGAPGVPDRPYMEPRVVQVRKMLRRACEELAASAAAEEGKDDAADRFVPMQDVLARVESYTFGNNAVTMEELLDLCETEGNEINGGGSFDVRGDKPGTQSIRFVPGTGQTSSQPRNKWQAPGEIGSPVVGAGSFGSNGR
ncbi:Salt tolerance down-regulator domain containing protein [Naviculisporaceae sp. PSN 640]